MSAGVSALVGVVATVVAELAAGEEIEELPTVEAALEGVEETAEASDEGRPELATALETGPRLVAMISGAYAEAPKSWSDASMLQRLVPFWKYPLG